MKPEDVEKLEFELVTEAVFRRYGHDFRRYAKSHVHRRLRQMADKWGVSRISGLLPLILHDEQAFERMLQELSITVTEMFRDPLFYRRLRAEVIPYLRTYPFVRAWVAGCASGEEAYSLAILLKEESLSERSTIYATDFNDTALEKGRAGIFALDNIRKYAENYRGSGGTASFSDYCHATADGALMDPELRRNIVFANHNLAVDGVFSEVNLIFCRNVLIYFDPGLQERVMGLFTESLMRNGFLCLGEYEEVVPAFSRRYRRLDEHARIFQLKTVGSGSRR